MADTKHHEKSPSKFPQYDKCPCYESAPAGPAAQAGTYEHSILEKLMKGEKVEEVEKSTFDKVFWAYETILNEIQKIGEALNDQVRPEDIKIEERVEIMDDEFNQITFGTIDVGFKNYIWDYKSGNMYNYWPQMAVYALGVMQSLGINSVTAFVVYGRFKKCDRYEITYEQAHDFVFETVAKLNDPDKVPVKNDYCNWCIKNPCKAISKPVKSVVKKMIPADSSITTRRLNDLMKKPIAELTSSQVAELMPIAEIAADWAAAMKKYCRSLLDKNEQVAGYGLSSSPGNQTIKDTVRALELSCIKEDQFLACCSVSIPKLSDVVAKAEDLKKTEARRVIEDRLSEVITRGKDKVSMVKNG